MTVFDTICWPVCFLLMHRLSVRQNSLLKQLQEQGKRIEQLSRIEHDLIREVHPQVSQIKQELEEVAGSVKADPTNPSAKQ
jgi:hypothetical protein